MQPTRVGFFRELRHGDPQGPSLRETQGALSAEKCEAAAHYLEVAPTLAATPGYVGDVLDPSNTMIGSPDLKTDGDWMWPADLAYYVRRYQVALPESFLLHMQSMNWDPPALSRRRLHELTEAVLGAS